MTYRIPPPTDDRAVQAVPDALAMVDAVRRFDRRDIHHLLRQTDLHALVVVLAAMVDQDRTPKDLLGWVQTADSFDGWLWPEVLAAHAQYQLCMTRGVEVPVEVRAGQRVYDRVRARQRRAA